MALRLKDILKTLEEIAPPHYAASWDNTGLQIGAPDDSIRSVLVALDVNPAVVREAARKKVDLIVTHHPMLFRPLKQIRTDSGPGSLVRRLLKADIAVYASHTNLDVVRDGVNDLLGKALGLQEWSPIREISDQGIGWGRIGHLKKAKKIEDFISELKESLELPWLRVVGPTKGWVTRVACCSGSGASLFPEVVRHKPDLFITGDVKYHEALDFLMEGITVLDIGHFASEQGVRKALAQRLRRSFKKLGEPIPVYVSRSEQDPFDIF